MVIFIACVAAAPGKGGPEGRGEKNTLLCPQNAQHRPLFMCGVVVTACVIFFFFPPISRVKGV
jgi:hypothetical protein